MYATLRYFIDFILTFLAFLSLAYIKYSCGKGTKCEVVVVLVLTVDRLKADLLVVNAANAWEINIRRVFRYANW